MTFPPRGNYPPPAAQITVPDLSALRTPAGSARPPDPPTEPMPLHVTVRWANRSGGLGGDAQFANVLMGRDAGLGMIVLERQDDSGEVFLIPPSAVQWLRVHHNDRTPLGVVADAAQ